MNFDSLKMLARQCGFAEAGLCSAEDFSEQKRLVDAQPSLKERQQLRFSPADDDAKTKSLLVLLWPYAQVKMPAGRALFVDGYYEASNMAYHAARRLEKLLTDQGVYARANVSYPARTAALRAGMGVIGKNGLLIHPRYGSRVVIILMATDVMCEKETPCMPQGCLSCGRCIAACPSGALNENGCSHPERCHRNYIMEGVVVPESERNRIGNRLLGCDLCQRVCPMQPKGEAVPYAVSLDDLITADEQEFAAQAARLAALVGRNVARPQRIRAQAALLCAILGNTSDLPALQVWAESGHDAVREHARWAIAQILSRKDCHAGDEA